MSHIFKCLFEKKMNIVRPSQVEKHEKSHIYSMFEFIELCPSYTRKRTVNREKKYLTLMYKNGVREESKNF